MCYYLRLFMYQASYIYYVLFRPFYIRWSLCIKKIQLIKEVGMAYQEVCKLGRNAIKVKGVCKALSIPTSFRITVQCRVKYIEMGLCNFVLPESSLPLTIHSSTDQN